MSYIMVFLFTSYYFKLLYHIALPVSTSHNCDFHEVEFLSTLSAIMLGSYTGDYHMMCTYIIRTHGFTMI